MWAAACFNGSVVYNIHTVDVNAHTSFSYQSAKWKQTIRRRPPPRWVRYIAGVNVLLNVLEMPGIDAVVSGNAVAGTALPSRAGDFVCGVGTRSTRLPATRANCSTSPSASAANTSRDKPSAPIIGKNKTSVT